MQFSSNVRQCLVRLLTRVAGSALLKRCAIALKPVDRACLVRVAGLTGFVGYGIH